jgi:cell division protein ZapE
MLPSQLYQQHIAAGKIIENPLQRQVLTLLDSIAIALSSTTHPKNCLQQLMNKIHPPTPVKGLYLWGNVGIGKTYLMDLFYTCIETKKLRIHFHAFMQRIHQELREVQGQKNPLRLIAKKIAKETAVLCFDEFSVDNIADAMLLGELFGSLLEANICLITSSNIAPDDLYKNGLQRERFLPAIALIKKHTHVFYLHSSQDYRLRHILQAGVYYTPADKTANFHLENCFVHYSKNEPIFSTPIEILGRKIQTIKYADQTIWFDFIALCGIPRSQNDYLELIKHYRTWLISDIPTISERQDFLITNFIHLIDILYDARVRLVVSAAASVTNLYTKGRFVTEFQRAKSRLIEMQSADYFSPGSSGPLLTTL